jgi:hypothetical protein
MIVTLSTQTYDIDGFVTLRAKPSSSFGDITRRVTVIKTLDGGVAVNDGGSSQGDRLAVVMWRTKDVEFEQNIGRIVESYSRLNMSSHSGFFEVAPTSYVQSGADSVLNLSILSKL